MLIQLESKIKFTVIRFFCLILFVLLFYFSFSKSAFAQFCGTNTSLFVHSCQGFNNCAYCGNGPSSSEDTPCYTFGGSQCKATVFGGAGCGGNTPVKTGCTTIGGVTTCTGCDCGQPQDNTVNCAYNPTPTPGGTPLPPPPPPTPTPVGGSCGNNGCGCYSNVPPCPANRPTFVGNPSQCSGGQQVCCQNACPPPPTTPPDNPTTGYHDQYSGSQEQINCVAAGWGTDPDSGQTRVVYRVLSDGTQVASAVADQFRGDLLAAGVCPGGDCSFFANIYGGVTHDVPHNITVQVQDNETKAWQSLNSTPKTLTCCTAVSTPTNVTPAGTQAAPYPLACGATTQTFTWTAVVGASQYNLKLYDLQNGAADAAHHPNIWNCGLVQLPGDQCKYSAGASNTIGGLQGGHSYKLEVQEINSCNNWSGHGDTWFTVLSSLSLTPAGSQNVAAGSLTNFTASLVPAGTAVDSVNFASSDTTNATVSPTSDVASPYQSTATAVSSGVAVITATAVKNGNNICTSNSTTVNVGNNTTGWWQVKGGDVTSHGNIQSLIATTCSGACTQIFNLQGSSGYPGFNLFNGSSDYSGGAGGGTGGQGNNWNINGSIDPSNLSYATFKGQLPQDVLANMVQLTSATAGCSVIAGGVSCTNAPFSTGTLTRGYYWYHYDGAVSGDLSILQAGPNSGIALTGGRKAILMVENADLLVNGTIKMTAPGSDFFMTMVSKNAGGTKGNIKINGAITSANLATFAIQGLYFAENTIQTGASANLLALQGSFVGLGGVILQRGLVDNSQSPAEYFEYAPQMELNYPPLLTSKKLQWQEVAP